MSEWLRFFGTEPRLLGLATIGGLLSLALVVYQAGRYVYRFWRSFRLGLLSRRRARLKKQIDDFRDGRMRKRLGYSDFVIAIPSLEKAVRRLQAVASGFVILLLNLSIYLMNGYKPSGIVTIGQSILIILDFFGMCAALHNALYVVAAANYPAANRQQLLAKAKRLKKR